MTSTKVTEQERRTTIQLRWGQLYTNKLAHRYKLSETSKCPLCGKEDGGYHAVSGCKEVSRPVTQRHNQAGRDIVQCISKGTRAQELVMSDVGMHKHIHSEDMPANTTARVPRAILPDTMPDAVRTSLITGSIPAAMLYAPPTDAQPAKYTIVEIKYCRDTNTNDQEHRAAKQHDHLIKELQAYSPSATVTQVTLLLGVSGTIFNSTIQNLETLGVHEWRLKGLLKRLHLHAVKSLTRIWKYRRAQLAKTQGISIRAWKRAARTPWNNSKRRRFQPP